MRTIANYEKGIIQVITLYTLNQFETRIKHQSYSPDALITAEYYSNQIDAEAGHQIWINKIEANDKLPNLVDLPIGKRDGSFAQIDKSNQYIKITLAAVMRIFAKFTSNESQIKISASERCPGCLLLSITAGEYRGAMMYDPIRKEAHRVTKLWNAIIEQEKAMSSDKAEGGEVLSV